MELRVGTCAGHFQSVAATLRATDAVVLPVLFTAAVEAGGGGPLQSSVPRELLALAMHRVLQRTHHAGAHACLHCVPNSTYMYADAMTARPTWLHLVSESAVFELLSMHAALLC